MTSISNQLPQWFLDKRDAEYKTLLEEYDPNKVGELGWKYLNSEGAKVRDRILSGGLITLSMCGGGYAGAKTGSYLGAKYGGFTGYGALFTTIISGLAGGTIGGYVSYHAVNSIVQKAKSFENWKTCKLTTGVSEIFDKSFKKYLLKTYNTLPAEKQNSCVEPFKHPVTLNGNYLYEKADIAGLNKDENGKVTDPQTEKQYLPSEYLPAHRNIINLSALKIANLYKEMELEQVDWTVRWHLTEYLSKESTFLGEFTTKLGDLVDNVFTRLHKENDDKIEENNKIRDNKLESIKNLQKNQNTDPERLANRRSCIYMQVAILMSEENSLENRRKNFKKQQKIFKKHVNIVRKTAKRIKNIIQNLRDQKVESSQVSNAHRMIKKLVKILVDTTYYSQIPWIPKKIYKSQL